MIQMEPWAWVRFTGATGAVLQSRGVASVTRNGAGDYQIVLDREIDATEFHMAAHGIGGAAGDAVEWTAVHTSDVSKQVLAFSNAGAAADPTTVQVMIWRMSGGSGR